MRLLRTYAVTIYGLVVLALIIGGGVIQIQYDAGLHGLLYHFFLIPVLGCMFYIPYEILREPVFSVIAGLAFCAIVDYVRHRVRLRRRKSA